MSDTAVPFGFVIDSPSLEEAIVVRNGNVYLMAEGREAPPLWLSRVEDEPSGHEWTQPHTLKGWLKNVVTGELSPVMRDEFFEWSASLADRPTEAEKLGLSSHLDDERYMQVGKRERVHTCGYVIPRHLKSCDHCE